MDPTSSLTWQVTPTGGEMEWDAAKIHCQNLDLACGGWHLPDIGELRTLIRGCPGTQKNGACGVVNSCLYSSCWNDSCSGCSLNDGPAEGGMYWPNEIEGDSNWNWSSSPVDGNDGYAWLVYFEYGYVNSSAVDGGRRARCVR